MLVQMLVHKAKSTYKINCKCLILRLPLQDLNLRPSD